MNTLIYHYIKRIHKKDSSSNRTDIYNYLNSNKATFRLFKFVDQNLHIRFIRELLLLSWGIIVFIKTKINFTPNFIFINKTPREREITHEFLNIFCNVKCIRRIGLNFKSFMLLKVFQIYRILKLVNKRHGLLISFRITEYLFTYFKLVNIGQKFDSSLIISSLTPSNAALLTFSSRCNVKSVFIASGLDTHPFFDQDVDIIIGGSPYNTNHIKNCSLVFSKLLSSQKSDAIKLGKISTLGIFTSGTINYETLSVLISRFERDSNIDEIIIRSHPNQFLQLSQKWIIEKGFKKVKMSPSSLTESIRLCDLILAGNSSVHTDSIRLGTPTFFVENLDYSERDLFRYLENDFLLTLPNIECSLEDVISSFLSKKNWLDSKDLYIGQGLNESDITQIRKHLKIEKIHS